MKDAIADVLGVDASEISANCTKDASDSTNMLCDVKIPDGVDKPEDFAQKVKDAMEAAGPPSNLEVGEQTTGKVCLGSYFLRNRLYFASTGFPFFFEEGLLFFLNENTQMF